MSNSNYKAASVVIKALIEGTDPTTGEVVPPGSVIHQAPVLRALLTASVALAEGVARAERRAQLPGNVGKAWTKDEEATLIAAYKSHEGLAAIATRHGRTIRSIEARLERLGLMTAAERITNNSFVSTGKGSSDE
jgi:hypothetical protein